MLRFHRRKEKSTRIIFLFKLSKARAKGMIYVDAEPKVALVVRIKG